MTHACGVGVDCTCMQHYLKYDCMFGEATSCCEGRYLECNMAMYIVCPCSMLCVLSNRLLPECMQWSPEVKCGISSAPLTNQYGHCMLVALIHAILKLKSEFEFLLKAYVEVKCYN